jgi:hypothetical protein
MNSFWRETNPREREQYFKQQRGEQQLEEQYSKIWDLAIKPLPIKSKMVSEKIYFYFPKVIDADIASRFESKSAS